MNRFYKTKMTFCVTIILKMENDISQEYNFTILIKRQASNERSQMLSIDTHQVIEIIVCNYNNCTILANNITKI